MIPMNTPETQTKRKDYGPCVGCEEALHWVENIETADTEKKERVLRRMEYEFDKDIPVKPKFHKGKYGSQYDSCTCGHCGCTIAEACWKYCPNCGFRIGRR